MKKTYFPLLFSLLLTFIFSWKTNAQDIPFIGEIKISALPNFIPRGYAECRGQLLPIAQNQALFSLIGTTYGGNGVTTFALPNLAGRVAAGIGGGPGLTGRSLGEVYGVESVYLLPQNLPTHAHTLQVYNGPGNTNSANGNSLATGQTLDLNNLEAPYTNANPDVSLSLQTVSGNNNNLTPIDNRQPYLTMTYIIALQGIFPSFN